MTAVVARAPAEEPEGLLLRPEVISRTEEAALLDRLGTLEWGPAGAARSSWEHSIPPTKALRYSITFRTLR